ncbi:GDP-mannose 4,6-dehydratase [Leifsonia sp. H3M29-4]|uniref:GDP-mannose 4,6-dehydratase n=1 Tax=Salinibacterium metalliresistens TaxID=3031321 RepID=UPI0023DB4C8F|nr:GDP-mannose 4,6-dehydratase [Salinibacterium metalliresistens]MDF1479174.1 GDP-mannose 4,6-dehydratase [Salinibacterium metalliresistens]
MMRALVTGVTGQDGSYLAEALVSAGQEVHGVVRDIGETVTAGVQPHRVDFAEEGGLAAVVSEVRPDVIYNLAAVSSVFRSWEEPTVTARVNALAVAELLAAARSLGEGIRFVQASSAEIFGSPETAPQNESTPVRPTSPYGAAKAYAHGLVGVYRGAGMHASSVILYNHESPRRPETFVTRKITAAAARISRGLQDRLALGNLAARRDWGWAPDYVEALQLAAGADAPGDYVIATGVAHSVEDFVALAFARAGIADWRAYVDVDDTLLRAGDAPEQRGDAAKARRVLGWRPSHDFEQIVSAMVDADLARLDAPS